MKPILNILQTVLALVVLVICGAGLALISALGSAALFTLNSYIYADQPQLSYLDVQVLFLLTTIILAGLYAAYHRWVTLPKQRRYLLYLGPRPQRKVILLGRYFNGSNQGNQLPAAAGGKTEVSPVSPAPAA